MRSYKNKFNLVYRVIFKRWGTVYQDRLQALVSDYQHSGDVTGRVPPWGGSCLHRHRTGPGKSRPAAM